MLDLSPRALLLAIYLAWAGWPVRAQAPVWELARGRVDATEQEQQECYFRMGEAMVIFHPKSESCVVARVELLGRRGRLVFQVEP